MLQINKDELIESLKSIYDSRDLGFSMYVLKWEPQEDGGKKLLPFSTQYNENEILPEMRRHVLLGCIMQLGSHDSFKEYDPVDTPDESVIWTFDLSETENGIPTLSESIAPLSNEEGTFSISSDIDLANDIHGIMFHFYDWTENTYIFRKNWPKRVLRKGGSMKLVFGWGTLRTLPDEDTLTIPSWADCFFHNDVCYVFDRHGFRALFNFHEIEKGRAQVTIDELKAEMNFEFGEGFDLTHMVEDQHSMGKLSRPNKLVNRTAPFEKLCDINVNYNIGLVMDSTTGKVVLNDKKEAKKFLKILNDDYLKSEVSEKKYDSHSKESL